MPNFEVFTGRSRPAADQMLVSIQTRGNFSLNRAAYEALGKPEALELLFDRKARLVGLRPVESDLQHAYPVRKQPNSASYLVAGQAFCKTYNIPLGQQTRRYTATLSDGMLVADLNQKPIEVRSRRNGKANAD